MLKFHVNYSIYNNQFLSKIRHNTSEIKKQKIDIEFNLTNSIFQLENKKNKFNLD
jgi:hypothetical protein